MKLPETSIHTGSLILVNAAHPFHEPAPDLVDIGSGVLLARQPSRVLLQILAHIHRGEQIVPVSGWRSKEEQTAIYTQALRDSGAEFTRQFVALPGCSEHQTGLAIDLALKSGSIDFIRPDFPYSGVCQVFRETAVRFGFIERYPKGKEHITGIAHEPWHFRYVGAPHAEIMQQHSLCLEEYIDFLKAAPYIYHSGETCIRITYCPQGDVEVENGTPYTVSGDNIDGSILTEWRAL